MKYKKIRKLNTKKPPPHPSLTQTLYNIISYLLNGIQNFNKCNKTTDIVYDH